jgi:hypothetical protein
MPLPISARGRGRSEENESLWAVAVEGMASQ